MTHLCKPEIPGLACSVLLLDLFEVVFRYLITGGNVVVNGNGVVVKEFFELSFHHTSHKSGLGAGTACPL